MQWRTLMADGYRMCDEVTEVPTAVPVDETLVQRTGYPDDSLTPLLPHPGA